MADNFDIPLARAGDPVTSHIAAEKLKDSGKWRGQKMRVLTWMRENKINDGTDLTASEMARDSGIPHPTCHKRLPDLEDAGWVVKCRKRVCRVTGELCWTWRLRTPEELAALSKVA